MDPHEAELLERLVPPTELDDSVLEAAQRLFESRGDQARARWAQLERRGYGADTEAGDLQTLLGGECKQDLLDAVLRSRVRHGRLVVGGAVRLWPHFFVESVSELQALSDRVSGGGSEELLVDLSSTGKPAVQLSFARHVFTDVLQAVAIELGDTIRRSGG